MTRGPGAAQPAGSIERFTPRDYSGVSAQGAKKAGVVVGPDVGAVRGHAAPTAVGRQDAESGGIRRQHGPRGRGAAAANLFGIAQLLLSNAPLQSGVLRKAGDDRRQIEIPVRDMENEEPARGKPRSIYSQRFPAEEMQRNRLRAVGVENQHVVAVSGRRQRQPAIAEPDTDHPGGIHEVGEPPRIPGDALNGRIDLEERPRLASQGVRRERAVAKAHDADASGARRERAEDLASWTARAVVAEWLSPAGRIDALDAMDRSTMQQLMVGSARVDRDAVDAEERSLAVHHM